MKLINKYLRPLGVCSLLALVISVPAGARSIKDLFRGKTGLVVSIGVVTLANALDYNYTVKTVYAGKGHEANPLFLNNQGVLDKDRLKGFKIGSGALVVGEIVTAKKWPKYRPLFTEANWAVGSALGFQAYRGRQLFNQ